jgi:hypothetical protein
MAALEKKYLPEPAVAGHIKVQQWKKMAHQVKHLLLQDLRNLPDNGTKTGGYYIPSTAAASY